MKGLRLSAFSRRRPRTAAIFTALSLIAISASFAHPTGHQGRDEVRLQITSDGFAPAEVQHGPGAFAIAVENTTLSGEYTLRLKAEDGTVLHEVQVQKGSVAWTVNLQTGRYTLTEVNHSEWVSTIIVQ